MNLPKAVLFDFDGVVVDSLKAHHHGWAVGFNQLFNKEICPFPVETHAGVAPTLIAEYYAEFGGDIFLAPELMKKKHEVMLSGEVVADLLPGVKEITASLRKHNIPYGIASNASKHYVSKTVEWLKIDFTTTMGFEDYEKPKPSPLAYKTLAKALNVSEKDYHNTWVFEDSKTGIKAAHSAGMHPFGIKGEGNNQELTENGANKIFSSLLDAHNHLF